MMGVRRYTKNREDKILEGFIKQIGFPDNPTALEFGAGSGRIDSNIYLFKKWYEWRIIQWDCNPKYENAAGQVVIECVTPENINDLMKKYNVPHDLAILSIDVDGQDWHIWKAIRPEVCSPRLTIIEYNCYFPADVRAVLKKDAGRTRLPNYGASFRSMCELAAEKDLVLLAEIAWTNLIFAPRKLVSSSPTIKVDLPHQLHKGEMKINPDYFTY
jgi:hypothetical protein